MERLISSSALPARTALLKPRPIAAVKRGLSLVSLRSGLSPFRAVSSGEDGGLRSPAFPWFFSIPLLETKAREGKATAESAERRDLARFVTRKDASAAVTILLSALVVAVILPILAPAAYAAIPFAAKTGGTLFKSELLSSAWTGFFAGCLHTLSGPDHLAALAPLSIGRTRVESAVVGALWGCGHDAGQMIFGLLFLLLKDRLHIEIIRTWGTRVVGLTLLVIGGMGIREASEVPAPCVALENGECDVSLMESIETLPSGKKKIGFATFATGIVHGLQPDALMMVLPALALPSRLAGAAFLERYTMSFNPSFDGSL
ncbi:uncharacterized protein LOC120275407 isoform X3 [Dioscorea cayenensis subsp. rotundata]|uniref:Uncharacterized protein LOC120275407 isoform X3 n=1 Tax=Dioscorea cayennensis subsp. rotundata TaxID=55577 RepID=A0AB40CDB9_DIOCR|nr:uncharacterized protein LOC120275407 isoform X3 [Dioscorea cayenensis subsp. rotundata]